MSGTNIDLTGDLKVNGTINSSQKIIFQDLSGQNLDIVEISANVMDVAVLRVNGKSITQNGGGSSGGGTTTSTGIKKESSHPNNDVSGNIYYNNTTIDKNANVIDINNNVNNSRGNVFYSGFNDFPDVSGGWKDWDFLFL